MVPGPRPFIVRYDEARHQGIQAYRLFFGVKANDGRFSIHSITEEGQREYQVVGRKEGFTKIPDAEGSPSELALLWKAGFRALGVANNHSTDLGDAGREATRAALRNAGLEALSYEDSPVFLKMGAHTVAIVAVSAVRGRDGTRVEIPSIPVQQKLRLARHLADLLVVFIHWGSELLEWPDVKQREIMPACFEKKPASRFRC